jgi:hypothetical protein
MSAFDVPEPPRSFEPPIYPEQKSTNGWSIASLVCGLLLCIPFFTSLLAVVFGAIGLGKTRDPRYSGKAMAITGIVLGVLGLVGWGFFSFAMFQVVQTIAVPVAKATLFARALHSGDLETASQSIAPPLTREDLEQIAERSRNLGALQSLQPTTFSDKTNNGVRTLQISGTAIFVNGNAPFTIEMGGGEDLKVTNYSLMIP